MLSLRGGVVMAAEEQLRDLVGTLLMVPGDSVSAATSMAALQNSLGGAKLRLGLKRLGVQLPTGERPATFQHLCELVRDAAGGIKPARD